MPAPQEEAEAEYKQQYPDHFAAFADLLPEEEQQDGDGANPAAGGGDGEMMAADDQQQGLGKGQARSAAAKALIQGQLLGEVVGLHKALYTGLVQQQQQQGLQEGGEASTTAAVSEGGAAAARRRLAELSYKLGQQLLVVQGGSMPPGVDEVARGGHLWKLAQEHATLNTGAALTAAAATAGSTAASSKGTAAAGDGGWELLVAATAPKKVLDMQLPFPEEASLLQAPVSAVAKRVELLLQEWPEHPLLLQLLGICSRLLGMPLSSPLKSVLTGVELLLTRAQVWEETAAQHVTLKEELRQVGGLGTRWRKLELGSWSGVLERAVEKHAAGAARSWFHLYALLMEAPAAAAAAGGVGGGGEGEGLDAEEVEYRRVASLLEAFVQTSTVGEFAARLELLYSFACQLQVHATTSAGDDSNTPTAAAAAAAGTGGSSDTGCRSYLTFAAAVRNVMSYYSQFSGAVAAAVAAGLTPLSKELHDFVALAKWDDRGHYALRISIEKSQRQLHRLQRRAASVLNQPAAEILAGASQKMGLEGLALTTTANAAAATAGGAATAIGKEATATAGAAAGGDGKEVAGAGAASGTAPAAAATPPSGGGGVAEPRVLGELTPEELSPALAAAGLQGFSSSSSTGSTNVTAISRAAVAAAASGRKGRGRGRRKKGREGLGLDGVGVIPLEEALELVAEEDAAAWKGFSARVVAEAAEGVSGQPSTEQQQQREEGGRVMGLSAGKYTSRMPQLLPKVAQVLAPVAPVYNETVGPTAAAEDTAEDTAAAAAAGGGGGGVADASAAIVGQDDATEPTAAAAAGGMDDDTDAADLASELIGLPAAVRLDELGAAAADRALVLRSDTSKGARARKKKALTDLLHALQDTGFSKRAGDVPAGDRSPADWFKQPPPELLTTGVLNSNPNHLNPKSAVAAPGAVGYQRQLLASVCWVKADVYYYRSLARLQRLEAAVVAAPHRDLAAHEVTAAVRYCQHQLHLLRRQRRLVGEAAAAHGEMRDLCNWLQQLKSSPQHGHGATAGASLMDVEMKGEDSGAGIGGGREVDLLSVPLPAQEWLRGWLLSTKQLLDGVLYQLAGQQQLLEAVAQVTTDSRAGAAATARPGRQQQQVLVAAAAGRVRCWVEVLGRCKVMLDKQVGVVGVAGCPVLLPAAGAVVADVLLQLERVWDEDVAVAADDGGEGGVPGWDKVSALLRYGASQAQLFRQQQQGQQQMLQQQQGMGGNGESLEVVTQQFSSGVEQLVSSALIWAQGKGGDTKKQHGAAAAGGGGGANAGVDGAVGWVESAESSLRPGKVMEIVQQGKQLLRMLAVACDATRSSSSSGSSVQQQELEVVREMRGQLLGVLPLLQLVLGSVKVQLAEFLTLHKSSAKLAYICTSLFCTLVQEGFCMPEGEAVEGGEGEGEGGEWKEAGGMGMGEGTGKKDVSDQIEDEDQLLGAQQKGQQQEEQQEEQGLEEDDARGVEMEGDFDGELYDVDKKEQAEDDEEEEEEGDAERLQQEMGEVRDTGGKGGRERGVIFEVA